MCYTVGMSFLIKTYTVDPEKHGVSWPAFPTEQTVASMDEARFLAVNRVHQSCPHDGPVPKALMRAAEKAQSLPEEGGEITLPDGTLIEVRPVGETQEIQEALDSAGGNLMPVGVESRLSCRAVRQTGCV